MTDTTHYYRIHNRGSGVDLGVFRGTDEDDAIRAMLLDANSHTTEPDPDLVAIEVEPLPETLDDLYEALTGMLDRVDDHVDDDPRLPTLTMEDLVRDRWGIDMTDLPVYGGPDPAGVGNIWSWDAGRLLVQVADHRCWALVSRHA